MYFRSGGVDPGRDGCRVPLPWRGTSAPYGFSSGAAGAVAAPWLPQPADWASLTVEAQQSDPASMLWLYRQALRIRRAEASLGDGPLVWLDSEPSVLAFSRGGGFLNISNLSAHPVELLGHSAIILSSSPLVGGLLPPDSTAWLRTQH
jgi:alpha-glucosidase